MFSDPEFLILALLALLIGAPVVLFFAWAMSKPPGFLAGDDERDAE